VILTELPDLPPRPETARNVAFRRQFYSRWGKENWIVCGAARYAEYQTYRQTFSVKMVLKGREHFFVDRRRLTVTDETYLVLNEGREYSSVLEGLEAAFSFCIFFRPGMAAQVAQAARLNVGQALDAGEHLDDAPQVEISENLRPHDKTVSPVLRYIRRHVELGVDDPAWYEEQFNFLLGRILRSEQDGAKLPERINCVRTAKRKELMKRLGWASDFMHSNLHRELALADIAAAARLSQYHFLRLFRQVHGMTPMSYLRAQRTRRALALLENTQLEINEIAQQVGLSRLALWRSVRDAHGRGPKRLRRELQATPVSAPSISR
jgi:AraC family transcriptional regulator